MSRLARSLRCRATVLVAGLLVLIGVAVDPLRGAADSVSPTLASDEVREGMRGYGRTVFEGTRTDTFGVEVLGVLENVFPDQDLILIRADREPPLQTTNIMSGMSGSPIYVNGKLIGALAYSWPFQKEPIAGVTPIENMLRAGPRSVGSTGDGGRDLRPISTPIVAAGIPSSVRDRLSAVFEERGVTTHFVTGGSGASGHGAKGSGSSGLEPGDAVGAQLMRGDLSLTGIGTVTHRDKDRIYAFGHQFMNAGRIRMPMTAAEVHTSMPSLRSSFKLASPLGTVGTVVEDRQAALVGRLGATADLIPVRVDLRVPDHGFRQTYEVEVVRNRFLSAGLINSAAASFARTKINQLGFNRLESRVHVALDEHSDIRFRRTSLVKGSFDPWAFLPLTYLWSNPFSEVRVREVQVTMTLHPKQSVARIADLWLNRDTVRPGETVQVFVKLEPFRKRDRVRVFEVTVPDGLPAGKVRFRVLPASNLSHSDAPPTTLDQLVDWFNRPRSPHQLAVVLDYPSLGMNAAGRRMDRLPWSLSGAYQRAQKSAVQFHPSDQRTIVDLDRTLRGQQSLVVEVRP